MTTRTYAATRTVLNTATDTAITVSGDIGDSPGEPQSMLATVDFGGTESVEAKTTVTNFTWRAVVGDRARPICRVVGRPGALGLDDEDALLDDVRAVVTNIQDGVSFDIVARAPQGTTGLYEVQIMGG